MDIDSLRIVLAVAKHGGFAAAARSLGVDPSSVSRSVANLEAEVGLRIFQRTTRSNTLTEEGERYLKRVEPVLEELEAAREEAMLGREKPSGTLRITSSVAFAHECIVPLLADFNARYPDVTIELLPTDANIDLLQNGIDLAVRLAAAPDGEVISSRLLKTRYHVCASPAYLDAIGDLSGPEALSKLDCLRFALPEFRSQWKFRKSGGTPFPVDINGSVLISNALSLRQVARNGLGPTLLADWLIGRDLAEGRLVDVFPDYECAATEFDTGAWLLYPSRSYLPMKVRVMIDFLRETIPAAQRQWRSQASKV